MDVYLGLRSVSILSAPERTELLKRLGGINRSLNVSILSAPERTELLPQRGLVRVYSSGFNPLRPRKDGATRMGTWQASLMISFNPLRPRKDGATYDVRVGDGIDPPVSILSAPERTELPI